MTNIPWVLQSFFLAVLVLLGIAAVIPIIYTIVLLWGWLSLLLFLVLWVWIYGSQC